MWTAKDPIRQRGGDTNFYTYVWKVLIPYGPYSNPSSLLDSILNANKQGQ